MMILFKSISWEPDMSDAKKRIHHTSDRAQFKTLLEELPAHFQRASEEQRRVLLGFLEGWNNSLRRKHHRKSCSIPVDFALGGKAFASIIRNIGAGGVFVERANGIDLGEQMTLAFWFPALEKPSKIKGEVVWRNPEGFGVQFKTTAFMEEELEQAVKRF
jgi:hypothetical protein